MLSPAASPAAVLSPAASPAAVLSPAAVRGIPAGARQAIVVTAPYGTSYARLTAYQRMAAGWRAVMGPMAARIGRNGFAPPGKRRQATGTTPSGVFSLGPSFGIAPSPGTRMSYRVVDRDDYWVYDPAKPRTYNTYQPTKPSPSAWRTGRQEHLVSYGAQYRYVVVIGFNKPRMVMDPTLRPNAARTVDTRAGGGIFLHVTGGSSGGSTAGCVSVAAPLMRRLLQWLDPAAAPVIAMGPAAVLAARPTSAAASVTSSSRAAAPAATPGTAVTTRFGRSRAGRPLVAVRLGPATAARTLVVVGVIHGNERPGTAVVARLRSLPLPPGLNVWLVPTINPDGMAANRRGNAAGVDLNRNFPAAWRLDRGGPNDSGPRAASEPETRAFMAWLGVVRPTLMVIVHSPLYGVDSYGAKSMATVRALGRATGFPVRSFDCRGGCHGTLTQWYNRGFRGQAITFEFGPGTPRAATVDRVAAGLLRVAATAPR